MAIFKFKSYYKMGPGVSKNEPEDSGLVRYFKIFFRKFWSLAYVNLIYCIFFIPLLALCLFLLHLAVNSPAADNTVILLLCFSPLALLGPANAGLVKITREFVREEPCFIWSDFMDAFRKNWKQSLAVSIFQYVGAVALFAAVWFYYNLIGNSFLYAVPFGLAVLFCLIFLFMSFYLELMVVTLNLRLKMLFKNALLLSFISIGRNFLTLLICGIIVALEVGFFIMSLAATQSAIVLFVAMTLMLFFSWLAYSANFMAFPTILRCIIEPYYKAHPEETSESILHPENTRQQEEEGPPADYEPPEYVYENGRMIHRSVAEKHSIFEDQGNPADKDDEA